MENLCYDGTVWVQILDQGYASEERTFHFIYFGKLYELQFLSENFIFSFRDSLLSVYRGGNTHMYRGLAICTERLATTTLYK